MARLKCGEPTTVTGVQVKLQERKARQSFYDERKSKELSSSKASQVIRVRQPVNKKVLVKAMVIDQVPAPVGPVPITSAKKLSVVQPPVPGNVNVSPRKSDISANRSTAPCNKSIPTFHSRQHIVVELLINHFMQILFIHKYVWPL